MIGMGLQVGRLWTRAEVTRGGVLRLVAIVVLTAAGFAAYQQLFSSFAPYDDEGYLLLSLRMFHEGRALYDDVYTQYGPAYYLLHGLLHGATGLPITHDVARLKTLAVWLLAASLGSAFVGRLTGNKVLALVALPAVFFHLDRLGLEPAHPQDVCLLVVLSALLLATYVRGSAGPARTPSPEAAGRLRDLCCLAVLGLLTAAAAMTKPNVGLLMFVPVASAMLFMAPPGSWVRWVRWSLVAFAMALPWVVARGHALSWRGALLPVNVSVAIAASAWLTTRLPSRPPLSWHSVRGFGVACLASCGLCAAAALLHGTSLAGLARGLVLQHRDFVDVFYEHPPVHAVAPLAAGLGALAAVAAVRGNVRIRRGIGLGVALLVVAIYVRYLTDSFVPLTHGADDRGHAALLVTLLTPFAWLGLWPYRQPEDAVEDWLADRWFARLMLVLLAAVFPLVAYPIPGTQMALGSLPLLLLLIVVLGDCLRGMWEWRGEEARFRRGLVGALLALSLLTLACRDIGFWRQRATFTPLGLPGAERLRLPPAWVAREQWAVAQLRAHADSFVCLQSGHNSLYLWSQLEPPTGWNTTLWQDLLSDARQCDVIRALEEQQRVCLVVDRAEPPPKRPDGPLAQYLEKRFTTYHGRNRSLEIRGRSL